MASSLRVEGAGWVRGCLSVDFVHKVSDRRGSCLFSPRHAVSSPDYVHSLLSFMQYKLR